MEASLETTGGFTMIELLISVMVIGILASVAVPQYFKVVEKTKVSEAADVFLALNEAQNRYNAKYGVYCTGASACGGMDYTFPNLSYFSMGSITAGATGSNVNSWKLSITRSGTPPAVYGAYVLTYDVEPGAAPVLSCSQSSCQTYLLPAP